MNTKSNFDIFVPFSSLVILIIIIICKPDHLNEILDIIKENTGLELIHVIALSIIIIALLSFLIWVINSYFNDLQKKKDRLIIMNKQKEALIEFFKIANGENWLDNTNWCGNKNSRTRYDLSKYKNNYSSNSLISFILSFQKTDINDIISWRGVVCNEEGYITKLILSDNNINGDATKIFNILMKICTEIEEIDFRENNITGYLPMELPIKLNKLSGLYLNDNKLEGKIPNEFVLMDNLRGIYLFNNYFIERAETKLLFEESNKIRIKANAPEIIFYI